MNEFSVVHWLDEAERHRCGYCKNESSSVTYGMWAQSLTVDDYQNLIDRGWRRSGKYCYKPVMDQTCCPQYTIKCEALKFSLSKSHKKLIKKFNKYLNDDNLGTNSFGNKNCEEEKEEDEETSDVIQPSTSQKSVEPKRGLGADPTKPPCKKAKLLRIEKKEEKLKKIGINAEKSIESTSMAKTLEQFLNVNHTKIQFQIKLISVRGEDWEKTKNIEFDLYKKYQMIVHCDPIEKLTFKGFDRFLRTTPLEIKLEKMSLTNETFKQSAKLFEKYQLIIHNDKPDECNEEQFTHFLIETPLKMRQINENYSFGTFHQQYWFNDKLIAVGVIDILPKCVSSVYFFYDPDYRCLTLGTYGSLREIHFTREMSRIVPNLTEYYMGFYIHSCPKMRYKANLSPSYLLCPETYNWIPIEKCLPKLETVKYARLSDNDSIDVNSCTNEDLNNIKICLSTGILTRFRYFRNRFSDSIEEFQLIGKLIGKKCAANLIFIKN